jgi:hypothetical protein
MFTWLLFVSLDFSNTVKQTDIKGMAEADDHETVKELQVFRQLLLKEYYVTVYTCPRQVNIMMGK